MGGDTHHTDRMVAVGDCRDDRGRCGVGWWKSGEAHEVTLDEAWYGFAGFVAGSCLVMMLGAWMLNRMARDEEDRRRKGAHRK